jgi:hypothetical protein
MEASHLYFMGAMVDLTASCRPSPSISFHQPLTCTTLRLPVWLAALASVPEMSGPQLKYGTPLPPHPLHRCSRPGQTRLGVFPETNHTDPGR